MGITNRNIVIVVGAGASTEFGLPTGDQLKEKISQFGKQKKQNNNSQVSDEQINECFHWLSQARGGSVAGVPNLSRASIFISQNMSNAPSIDNFLHTHNEDQDVVDAGKLLITRAILHAESRSTLNIPKPYQSDRIDFDQGVRGNGNSYRIKPPKNSWLGELFRLLVAQKDFEGFVRSIEGIDFVSFNYDRCVEQYLLHAARDYFRLDHDELLRLQNSLSIRHPYGSLGRLELSNGVVKGFGSDLRPQQLIEISAGIRTFTEGSDSSFQESVLRKFSRNTILLFLGFGFLPLNMRLLFEDAELEVSIILATAMGLPSESPELIRSELKQVFRGSIDDSSKSHLSDRQVQLISSTGADMIWNHSRRLQRWLE